MTPEKLTIIKIVSHFLQYPDESLLNSLESVGEVILELPPGRPQEAFAEFLRYLQSRGLITLQEEYSRYFDLNPATCLNLTYHRYGDGKDRGVALAQLLQVYRRAGYETVTGELPDYLPLVLEFLAICPREEHAWMVEEYLPQLEALADRLNQTGTLYADLLSVAVENLRP